MRSHGKPILAAGCTALLLTLVIAVFWYQDWQYSLPTPRPETLKQPALGMVMSVAEVLPAELSISPELLELTRWVSEYYFAPWGEVLMAAVVSPSA